MTETKILEAPKEPKKITRRKFLELGAGAAVATLLTYLGIRQISSPEGKPSQRAGQFIEILKLIRNEPKNEDYKDLLVAWLKFAFVAEFGRLKDYRLAVATTEHFLDGHGESLDITNLLRDSVKHFNQRSGETDQQSLAHVFGEAIVKRTRELYIEKAPLSPSLEVLRQLANQPSVSREVELGFQTGTRPINNDVYYSLNVFTFNVKGNARAEIKESTRQGEPSKLNATIENPRITIDDEYDWIKGSPSETGVYLGQEIDNLLYRLFKIEKASKNLQIILGKDRYDRLYNTRGFTITDAEGELLMRYGFGTKFKVEASFSLQEPLSFQSPLAK